MCGLGGEEARKPLSLDVIPEGIAVSNLVPVDTCQKGEGERMSKSCWDYSANI